MYATIAIGVYLALFFVPSAMVAAYYFGLMILRVSGASASCPAGTSCRHRFVIIIPAHNEEDLIAATLESVQELDYPGGRFDIYVLADNCSDRTAAVSQGYGVTCLIRTDPDNPGKGQALRWAFPQLLSSSYDAVIVLDADCTIDCHALKVFDECLANGHLVLQANYIISNPDASAISYLARIGNVTEYDFFYSPKSDLGLTVMLVGTGMVFHRSILERHPWQAISVTEDVEYALTLTEARIPVRFVSNVGVRQAAPERIDQLRPQRLRWAKGTLGLGRRQAVGLVLHGIRHPNMRLVDFGWTLAVVSRPLVLAHLLATVATGGLLQLWIGGRATQWLSAASLLLFGLYLIYFVAGIVRVGVSWHRLTLLLGAPSVGLRLLTIAASGLMSSDDAKWDRTPR